MECTMEKGSVTTEDLLEKIGSFGRYQFVLLVFSNYAIIGWAIFTFESDYFLTAEPRWKCSQNTTACNLTGTFGPGETNYEYRCGIPRQDWQFVYEYTSLVTEFDLVCERSAYGSYDITISAVGSIVGAAVMGIFSDKFGRKKTFFLGGFLATTVQLYCSFSPSFWAFAAMRCITGAAMAGIVGSAYILGTEYVGIRHRAMMGTSVLYSYPIGYMFMALIGYLERDWRTFTLITSLIGQEAMLPEAILPEATLPKAILQETALPEVILQEATLPEAILQDTGNCLTGSYFTGSYFTGSYFTGSQFGGSYSTGSYFTGVNLEKAIWPEATLPEATLPEATLPESILPEAILPEAILPEAILPEAILPKAVLLFRITPESLRWLLVKNRQKEAINTLQKIAKFNKRELEDDMEMPVFESERMVRLGDVSLLFTSEYAKTTIVVWYSWFVSSLMYSGIHLSAPNVGGSAYFNWFLAGLGEFVSKWCAIRVYNRFGRPKSVVVSHILAAVSALGSVILTYYDDGSTGFHVGKILLSMVFAIFFITIAYDGMYLITAELYPTVIRNVAMGTSQSFLGIGILASSYVVYLKRVHPLLPYGIMGANAFVSGLLCLTLKETKNEPILEILPEAKRKLNYANNDTDLALLNTIETEV